MMIVCIFSSHNYSESIIKGDFCNSLISILFNTNNLENTKNSKRVQEKNKISRKNSILYKDRQRYGRLCY